MFSGASNVSISGGSFVNQTHSPTSVLDRLSAAAAHSALHNASARTDASRCHKHTRINVLDHLERWGQEIPEVEEARIFWLHGGAGAGKSAVMQTLAERFVARGIALGSFFFSRSDPTRNTVEALIPTLVYQLAQLFPSTLQVLNQIIDYDPLIFKKSLQVQLLGLLLRPLQHLVQLGIISDAPRSPRVFLIDGLDECSDPVQQQAIIQAVVAVCHEHHLPVKFLIASRPELAISTAFGSYKPAARFFQALSLSEDPDAEADIRRYLEDEFLKIRSQHSFKVMVPANWPAYYDVNRLVWKSSSHFIYASTAMKYIWWAKDDPVRSLQVVLGLEVSRTITPFSELDALYRHILGSAAHRDKVLQIVAHCLFSRLSPSLSVICIMLEYSLPDLFIFLADVGPLAVVTETSTESRSFGDRSGVKLLHRSLGEYLEDKSRSGSLHVDMKGYLASKLERCLQLLDQYSRDQCTIPDWPLSRLYSYSELMVQIKRTIKLSADTVVTQEVLSRHSPRTLHDSQMRFINNFPHSSLTKADVCVDLLAYVNAYKSLDISDGGHLFRIFLKDFIDIIESHLCEEGGSLAPAILPLLFSGYPPQFVADILAHANCFDNGKQRSLDRMSYFLISRCVSDLNYLHGSRRVQSSDVVTADDLASIRDHFHHSSALSSTLAAEVVLKYLQHGGKKTCHDRLGHEAADSMLFEAFVKLLRQSSYSEYIISCSTNSFLTKLFFGTRFLQNYIDRVQDEKLQPLSQRIDQGDVAALIEKSRMFYLNSQD